MSRVRAYVILPEFWLALATWIGLTLSEALPLVGRWDVVTLREPSLSVPYLATTVALGAVLGVARVDRERRMSRLPGLALDGFRRVLLLAIPIGAFALFPVILPPVVTRLQFDHVDHAHALGSWTAPDPLLLATFACWNLGSAALWLRALPIHPRLASLTLVLLGWFASPLATSGQIALAGALACTGAWLWPTRGGRLSSPSE